MTLSKIENWRSQWNELSSPTSASEKEHKIQNLFDSINSDFSNSMQPLTEYADAINFLRIIEKDPTLSFMQRKTTQAYMNASVEKILYTWVNEKQGSEQFPRLIAQRQILNFLNNPNETKLDLLGLRVFHLPEIFMHPRFTSLATLRIQSCQLRTLPESFENLKSLRYLSLWDNELSSIPESFGNLKTLTDLHISKNHIDRLPDSFGDLTALREVSLSENRLSHLPESFGNLRELRKVYLSDNSLEELPESFGNLSHLIELHIGKNTLSSLPDSFGGLQHLAVLVLSENRLSSPLPESFGNLIHLRELDLRGNRLSSLLESFGNFRELIILNLEQNPLRSLPSTITNLSSDIAIDITSMSLSQAVQDRIEEATRQEGYQGPRFFYSMHRQEARDEISRSVEDSIADLSRFAEKPPVVLSDDLKENRSLKAWLSRLSHMADYNAGGDTRKALAENVFNYLELASENPRFKDVFLSVIAYATETCGDRMALSILHLGIAYKVSKADLTKPREVADLLLKGVYALELLETVARQTVQTKPFVDEIEVYLGYPLKLKESLGLPIDVKDMLYFRCSALTTEDLESARIFVTSHLDNREECYKKLTSYDSWIQCIEKCVPSGFAAVKRVKIARQEGENPNDTQIEDAYKNELIHLTKQLLDTRFDVPSRSQRR